MNQMMSSKFTTDMLNFSTVSPIFFNEIEVHALNLHFLGQPRTGSKLLEDKESVLL